MLVPLVVALNTAPASAALRDDPPVRVWLDPDHPVQSGDRIRVRFQAAEDGYVLVLRADADGRVRVLYPLDPTADDFVRGGDEFEVRSRSDREAITVDEREGAGKVLVAWSAAPF